MCIDYFTWIKLFSAPSRQWFFSGNVNHSNSLGQRDYSSRMNVWPEASLSQWWFVRVFCGVELVTLKSELQKVNSLFLWVLNGCETWRIQAKHRGGKSERTAETLSWTPMWTTSDQCLLLYILWGFELSYFTYGLKDFKWFRNLSLSLKFLSVFYCLFTKVRVLIISCSSNFTFWVEKFCNIDTYYIAPNIQS